MKEDLDNVTLIPAVYNKSHPMTSNSAIDSFTCAGEDWIIQCIVHRWDNKPCSVRDMQVGDTVMLRYNHCMDIVMVTKTDEDEWDCCPCGEENEHEEIERKSDEKMMANMPKLTIGALLNSMK